MTTLQRMAETTEGNKRPVAGAAGSGEAPRYRSLVGGLVLAVAVLAALVAGGWGVVSSLTAEAPPARIGEPVEAGSGLVRVDAVTPEHMAPMQKGKFAASGMSMSSTGMDMAPEGFERFAVDVTLIAENGDLSYSPKDFRVGAKGVKDHGPVRAQLAEGDVAEGSAVSGILVFQAPEKAKNLTLSFDEGRKIALDLPASKDGGKEDEGHGH